MKIFVYGTLKKGYWNSPILGDSKLIKKHIVKGYKLLDNGFPVAVPSEKDSVSGEIWEIDPDVTLPRLDRLEGHPHMYVRTHLPDEDISLYVGNLNRWPVDKMTECPNDNNVYTWSKNHE